MKQVVIVLAALFAAVGFISALVIPLWGWRRAGQEISRGVVPDERRVFQRRAMAFVALGLILAVVATTLVGDSVDAAVLLILLVPVTIVAGSLARGVRSDRRRSR
jgi:hypothetical protein